MRELAFPEAKSFWDLFIEAVPYDCKLSQIGTEEEPHKDWYESWEFEDYDLATGRTSQETIRISPYCGICPGQSLSVRAKPEVYEFIRSNMIAAGVNDQICFEVVVRDNGEALILSKNSSIIGSRWLAVVPVETVPHQPEENE